MASHARDIDYEFALQLQKQFEAEKKMSKQKIVRGNESMNVALAVPQNKVGKIDLSDPHLEILDPTPNVHALFIQFDAIFFWKRLGGVAVRWSKRMYSCAGICRYERRGGMCDIALSEPLLKLRPRKDLIETLLHEMIHAYLFVTNNDRDRDGHGPNFHEHMYRINKAANVNITVYHTFIDEVRLYQTHWWRCNGPCNQRKPFFGIVRRSSNRAPGPNDFWWQNHQQGCGGMFIKVKEPEKKRATKNDSKKENKNKKLINTKGMADISKFIQPKNNPGPSKITTLKDYTNDSNCSCPGNSLSSNKQGGTMLVNKTKSTSTKPPEGSNKTIINLVREHWAQKYPALQDEQQNSDKDQARNHWATKYPEPPKQSNKNIKKSRKPQTNSTNSNSKKPKVDNNLNNSITNYMPDFKPPKKDECEDILKDIYGDNFKLTNKMIMKDDKPNKPVPNIVVPSTSISVIVNCPSCNKLVNEDNINAHLDLCILTDCNDRLNPSSQPQANEKRNHSSKSGDSINQKSEDSGEYKPKSKSNPKPVSHLENDCNTDSNVGIEFYTCPLCNNKVLKLMSNHLEDCVSNFFKGETEDIPESSFDETSNFHSDDELDESQEFNGTGTKFPCPCCLEMIEQENMNNHLDDCLGK